MKTLILLLSLVSVQALACTSSLECSMGESCIKAANATYLDAGQCMNTGNNFASDGIKTKDEPTLVQECTPSNAAMCPAGTQCTATFGTKGYCKKW